MKYVGVFAFSCKETMIALVQKNTKKIPHLNGRWNGIGGKMEIGESPVGAAMREFEEETGLTILKDNMVFVEHQRFYGGIALGDGRYCQGDEIYWYAVNQIEGADWHLPRANDVGENLAWVPVRNLRNMEQYGRLCPNLGYLIPKAITFLRTPYLDRPC
jgi:8-oxo-dGTP pyrophosphatase MutT (NUDIX family)